MSGSFLVGSVFDIAEKDRDAVTIREPIDLLMNHPPSVILSRGPGPVSRQLDGSSLGHPPPVRRQSGTSRHTAGDSMKPRAEGVAYPERPASPHEDEKGRLKRILRIVLILHDAAASAEDHRFVALDQCREGQFRRLVAPCGELLQELPVRQGGRCSQVEQ